LCIAVGVNPDKKTLFSEQERITLIERVVTDQLKKDAPRIVVKSFNGLLVNFAKEFGANLLIRGIRSVSDFEYEINLANVNKTLASQIETIFLLTSPNLSVVSSSMVKEIAKYQGDISPFVHPFVRHRLTSMFSQDKNE
jgi:pantetheine-phosphate adenylyltransferase